MRLMLLLFTLCSSSVHAQMTSRIVRDSLFIPWELVYGPDDHIWFTQKNGYICRLEPASGKIDTIHHETSSVVNNEGGMLGLALDPAFPAQPYVYVAYEYNQGGYKERIVRYTYSNNSFSAQQILLDNIVGASIHNGCRLLIVGDKLFITTGDAANTSLPQNIQALNGKTLRINLDGTIPADNPFPNNPVWSWGHRNAQGMVYANNKLYQSEHGANSDDEINIVEKGRNYGWPTVKGYCDQASEMTFCTDSNVVEPIEAWTPTIATSGMDYYNHPMFPSLQNSLLMTTLKDAKLYQLKLNSTHDSIISTTTIAGINYGRLRDICIAPDGKIYISTSTSNANGTTRIDKIIEIYDPLVNTVNDITTTGKIKVYPNPAGDYTTVQLSETTRNLTWFLIDNLGKTVRAAKADDARFFIATTGLADGIYQLRIVTERGKTYTAKIMKQ